MIKYLPSFKGIGGASVIAAEADDAIQQAAKQILDEARRLAEADDELTDFAESLHIDSGARPKGRGYARVIADSPDAEAVEYGDRATVRRRILGQAAGIEIFAGDKSS